MPRKAEPRKYYGFTAVSWRSLSINTMFRKLEEITWVAEPPFHDKVQHFFKRNKEILNMANWKGFHSKEG